jgi:hypothetical protein
MEMLNVFVKFGKSIFGLTFVAGGTPEMREFRSSQDPNQNRKGLDPERITGSTNVMRPMHEVLRQNVAAYVPLSGGLLLNACIRISLREEWESSVRVGTSGALGNCCRMKCDSGPMISGTRRTSSSQETGCPFLSDLSLQNTKHFQLETQTADTSHQSWLGRKGLWLLRYLEFRKYILG